MIRFKPIVFTLVGVLIVTTAAFLFLFKGCNRGSKPESIEPIVVGGVVMPGKGLQTIAIVNFFQPLEEPKFSIEGLPKEFKTSSNPQIGKESLQLQITAEVPVDYKLGTYPFKLNCSISDIKASFEGEVTVGQAQEGADKVFGGTGKNGVIGDIDPTGFVVLGRAELGSSITANIITVDDLIIVGTKTYLVGLNDKVKEVFRVKVTNYAIETLQTIEDKVITSDSIGIISIFDIASLYTKDPKPLVTFKGPTRLSAIPTIISNEKMVVGFVDGSIKMISLPNLREIWNNKPQAAISGAISVYTVKDQSIIYAGCQDKSVYLFDGSGKLIVRLTTAELLLGGPALFVNRLIVSLINSEIIVIDTLGQVQWKIIGPDRVKWQPIINKENILLASDTKIMSLSVIDGKEDWSVVLGGKVESQPVIISDTVVFCTNGKLMRLNLKDGDELESLPVGGQVSSWPVIFKNQLVVAERNGGISIFGKNENSGKIEPLDTNSIISNGCMVDLAHTNYIDVEFPTKLKQLWSLKGWFAPAITTKRHVFLYSITDKYFSCNEAKTGKQIWRYNSEATEGFFTSPGAHETPMYLTKNGLYIGTKQGLFLLNPYNGEVIKRSSIIGIPQATAEYVLVSSHLGLTCTDSNLKILWRKDGIYYQPNVAIDGEFVYVADRTKDNQGLYCLRIRNGSEVWKEKSDIISSPTKIMYSKDMIFTSNMTGIAVTDKKTKKTMPTPGLMMLVETFIQQTKFLAKDMSGFLLQFDFTKGIFSPIWILDPKKIKDPPSISSHAHAILTKNSMIAIGPKNKPKNTPPKTPPKLDPNQPQPKIEPKKAEPSNYFLGCFSSKEFKVLDKYDLGIIKNGMFSLTIGDEIVVTSLNDVGGQLRVYGP